MVDAQLPVQDSFAPQPAKHAVDSSELLPTFVRQLQLQPAPLEDKHLLILHIRKVIELGPIEIKYTYLKGIHNQTLKLV